MIVYDNLILWREYNNMMLVFHHCTLYKINVQKGQPHLCLYKIKVLEFCNFQDAPSIPDSFPMFSLKLFKGLLKKRNPERIIW